MLKADNGWRIAFLTVLIALVAASFGCGGGGSEPDSGSISPETESAADTDRVVASMSSGVIEEFGYVDDAGVKQLSWTAALPGDANGDWSVNGKDLFPISAGFGLTEGDEGYSACVDLNSDDAINGLDVHLIAANHGNRVLGWNIRGSDTARGDFGNPLNASVIEPATERAADCGFAHAYSLETTDEYFTLKAVTGESGEESCSLGYCYIAGGGDAQADFNIYTGEIFEIDGDSLLLGLTEYRLDEYSAVYDAWGNRIPGRELETGMRMTALGWLKQDANPVVVHLQAAEGIAALSVTGEYLGFDGVLSVSVADETMSFSVFHPDLAVCDAFGSDVGFEALEPGTEIDVWYYVEQGDLIVAAVHETASPIAEGFIDAAGTLDDLSALSISTLGGSPFCRVAFEFSIAQDTLVFSASGKPLLDATAVEGDPISIEGHYEGEALVADMVRLGEEFSFAGRDWLAYGVITEVDSAQDEITIQADGPWETGEMVLDVSGAEISDGFGKPAELSGLSAGERVKAWGLGQVKGVWTTARIVRGREAGRFFGGVFGRGDDWFTVGTTHNLNRRATLIVDDSTLYTDVWTGNTTGFSAACMVGDWVWGEWVEQDGACLATDVHFATRPVSRMPWYVRGRIFGIDYERRLMALALNNGDMFRLELRSWSDYRDAAGKKVDIRDFKVGDQVFANGWAEANAVVMDDGDGYFAGTVNYASMQALDVDGPGGFWLLNLTEQTRYFEPGMGELEPTYRVQGKFEQNGQGGLDALFVYNLGPVVPCGSPDNVAMYGAFGTMGEDGIKVYNDESYHFDVGMYLEEYTRCYDEYGDPIEFDQFAWCPTVLALGRFDWGLPGWGAHAEYFFKGPRDPIH